MGETVGLVGVGLVGAALAERLLAAGYGVLGYDIVSEKREHLVDLGGDAAECAREVGERCERVVLSLMTSEIVREVVGELLSADSPPSLIVDTTTGEPEATEELAAQLGERGVAHLDATISGSSAQVRAGEALFTIGGAEADVARAQDLLDTFTDRVIHVGPAGSGARSKLVINLIMGLNRVALAEGLAFAESMGMELHSLVPVLEASMAYSRIMDTKAGKMVDGDFSTHGRLDQHRKDVALILETATGLGQELPLSEAHLNVLDAGIAAGDAELDNSAIIQEMRRRRAE
ncbi:MAG TPA: NAD(P)-dependent oxidoreductase [Armatimonadota bacterium]|nr:NAD(P)-dependent oxidoreductase [Armatimonadota bacterium]